MQPAAARHAAHRVFHHERHRHEESYTPPYADIVLDANSGKVLHADKADDLRHPASLTKIMTLYLLFENLEAGRLRIDSQLPVSEHASEQAPTKLELRPGQTIEVEDAIRGLVTKSANDAAVVIAEAIGGSERDFAEMMTAKAHALGMTHTLYRNASGLPNDEQVTTARDQATLGRAIQERFPHYYRYFSTPSFTWQGETVRNHNHLLGRVEGMDGIKTGYTQASGFNLVASVRRDDRHIVGVVLGGTSAGARDSRMRSLIEDYIEVAAPQKTLVAKSDTKSDTKADTKADTAHREETARKDEARKDEARRDEARKDEARLNALVRQATAAPEAPRPRPAEVAKEAPPVATSAPGYAVASAGSEPIKPVQVRTLKVKMAPAEARMLGPTTNALAPSQLSADPAGEETAKPEAVDEPRQESQRQESQRQESQRQAPPRQDDEPKRVATGEPPKPEAAPEPRPERDLIAEAIRATVREGRAGAAAPAAPSSATATAAAVAIVPAPAATTDTPAAPAHVGWMIQVGAFDVEQEARERLDAVRSKAGTMLKNADAFTEAVTSGDKTFYRARFAGIQKDQAEAVCRRLKHNDIACMPIKN